LGRVLQHFCCPLVQALASCLRGNERTAMKLGGNAQQQLAGSGFLGMYALFLAIGQIVLNCKLKLVTQFGNRFAMETDDGANAKNASRKDIVTLVIIDAIGVPTEYAGR
jgi:hypothetical protein